MIPKTNDHLADVQAYCNAVLSGARPACKWEKLAVQRYLNDLERQNTPGFPYVFNTETACKIVDFGELFPHVKGKWARASGKANRIRFEAWQKFSLVNIFGWVHVDTGMRKYRIVYDEEPRKNGKSIKAAVVGLYLLAQDDEFGAEVYCGATSEKQAWEVFRPAIKMAEKQPSFRRAYGITCHAKRMEADTVGTKPRKDGSKRFPDGSRFEPVIGKPGDGASPSGAILDEVHEHPDDTLFDTMLTGMGAREQPLLMMITTAGSNIAGPCYAQRKELEAVLLGSIINEELFGIIYTVDDPETEWRTEEGMIKANPNLGVSISREFLEARVRDAETSPRKRSTVLTKHFNVWVTGKNAWLNMLLWNRQADPSLSESDFEGEVAKLGVDLSEVDDLTASVKCFRRDVDGERHYYLFGRYYATEAKVAENDHYDEWVQSGHLIQCDGETIDYDDVEEHIVADAEQFTIEQCFYDPHGAAHLAQRLEKHHSIEAVKVGQTYTNFSAPMRDFERLLKSGRIHHDGNPCLGWMFANVVAKETEDGKMMRPVKENRESKIDGAVAALMSFIGAFEPDDNDDDDFADYMRNPIRA